MKVISLIAVIILIIFAAKIEISFSPFSFKINGWKEVLGILLFSISIYLITSGIRRDSYVNGVKDGANLTISIIKQQIKDNRNN